MKLLPYTLIIFLLNMPNMLGVTHQVGSNKLYKTPNELYKANVIQNGDVIEIDGGTYSGNDVLANWDKDDLVIIGVDGRPHLKAEGKHIQGKGIWIISGNNIKVDNIEFSGAKVPDNNGAGIRMEGLNAHIINCYFHHNEDGILTHNNKDGNLLVEFCEFAYNGYGDGFTHNIYVGKINSLTFRYNYSHHAIVGHNLKSRANNNFIYYNRIMDEVDGRSSRLVDLPNGGLSILMGNIFMQGNDTENGNFIGYGLEGVINSGPNELYFINNTCVNKRIAFNYFIRAHADVPYMKVANNILSGDGAILGGKQNDLVNNIFEKVIDNNFFEDEAAYNYRLTDKSTAIDSGVAIDDVYGYSLTPTMAYKHNSDFEMRFNIDSRIDVGAYEYCRSNESSLKVESCYEYNWEGVDYTESGSYTSVKTNYGGCDSVVTLDLVIHGASSSTFSEVACDSIEWYGKTYSNSGTYSRITSNFNHCDSIIYMDLVVNRSSSDTIRIDTCRSFLFDKVIYGESGFYEINDISENGCDSTIVLDVNIESESMNTIVVDTCGSYIWLAEEYNSSGTYQKKFVSENGCDSLVVLDLTINPKKYGYTSINTCDYYINDNDTLYNSGTFYKYLTSAMGCDSLVTFAVDITHIDTSIVVSNNTLTSQETADSYKWLNCDDNYNYISGEEEKTFKPEKKGYYAVEISLNSCVDTSGCFLVEPNSIKSESGFVVYPNPSRDIINIAKNNINYTLIDQWGGIVRKGYSSSINLIGLVSGVYQLRLRDMNNEIRHYKIVKI